ncbi:hypothetical protein SAMN05421663_105296 [Terribacillus halophilus]|uniref:Uncharacterized protein n=1 Tax=Terribacillus halophilus TaxID=361279 RepID=A0A1G6R033_9BACI|nr:hypothetical protein SAMN05421663_105296 [Terribacillus halophilus]
MTASGWLILGVIILGVIVWLASGRLSYMFVYFALFSLGSFIYRLSNGQTFGDAFFNSFGLVDILVIIIASVLLIERIKDKRSDN